jgi:hypothetical protein
MRLATILHLSYLVLAAGSYALLAFHYYRKRRGRPLLAWLMMPHVLAYNCLALGATCALLATLVEFGPAHDQPNPAPVPEQRQLIAEPPQKRDDKGGDVKEANDRNGPARQVHEVLGEGDRFPDREAGSRP